MRYEEVPEHRLKGLGVRRDIVGVDRGHDDAGISHFGSVTAILAHQPDDPCADLFGELHRGDEIRGHVLLEVAAADRKDEQRVLCIEAAAAQPFGEHAGPAFVIGSCGEFGDIVRGSVAFHPGDLTEVVHGM